MNVKILGFLTLSLIVVHNIRATDSTVPGIEETLGPIVEKLVDSKTNALSSKVKNLEGIVEKQQARINELEARDIRNLRLLRNLEKSIIDHRGKNTGDVLQSRGKRNAEVVAFIAYLSHRVDNMGVGHHLVFDKVLTNDGAGYNKYTGVFTVPVDGLYLFTFSINSHYRSTLLQLVIDGKNIVDIIDVPVNSEEAMSSNTIFIHVRQGQSVWIQEYLREAGSVYATGDANYCTFSGVLLF